MPRSFHKLRVPHGVADLIRGMHPNLKRKVRASLDMILTDPDKGNALKGELTGLKSFRVSNFRIIYRISKKGIEIVALGPRQKIYEKTFLTLKRDGSI
jgi:mRNA interferase RelE/StbE